MIYVNQKQLDQVEYILEKSAQGLHILFDPEDIRRVFAATMTADGRIRPAPPSRKELSMDNKGEPTEAEKHIENLILQPTILSKKTYLESLTPEMYDDVVRTWFSIVENNIFDGMEYNH